MCSIHLAWVAHSSRCNPISWIHHLTATPAAGLSHRLNSDFLFDSQVILPTPGSSLCIGSHPRARGTGVWSVSHVTNPQLVSRLFIHFPQNTWRFSNNQTQTHRPPPAKKNPVNEKAQLSVFSPFGVVSFKLGPAGMRGVVSLCRNSARPVFTDSTYPEFTV